MQQTYEAKLPLDEATIALFDAWGRQYGRLKRILYQWVAKGGGKCKDYKVTFCEKYRKEGITARLFNALAIELQGLLDGTRELLKLRQEDLKKKHKAQVGKLKRAVGLEKRVMEGRQEVSDRQKKTMVDTLKFVPGKIKKTEKQLLEVEQRLKATVPGICFGTRKLFMKQFRLVEAGYVQALTEDEKRGKTAREIAMLEEQRHTEGFAKWLKDWRAARSHQFFFIGSKDEASGNVTCTATIVHREMRAKSGKLVTVLKLRIRRPDVVVQKGDAKEDRYHYVQIELSYGRESILEALDKGTAISYRFHRCAAKAVCHGVDTTKKVNETGVWYVQLMTDVEDKPKTSKDKAHGVLGIDFNEDHLAVTQTNTVGRFVKNWTVPMDLEGKNTEQREAVLSEALKWVVDYAQVNKLCIAVEKLDFAAKKQQMERKSKRYKRMLSGLMYEKYQQMLEAKCARAGVVLIAVDPAYTSVIGRTKYTYSYGISVHVAAAGVIARRAQELGESVPSAVKFEAGGCVSNLSIPVRNWENEQHQLAWYASQVRETLYRARVAQSSYDKLRCKSRRRCPDSDLDLLAGDVATQRYCADRRHATACPDLSQ